MFHKNMKGHEKLWKTVIYSISLEETVTSRLYLFILAVKKLPYMETFTIFLKQPRMTIFLLNPPILNFSLVKWTRQIYFIIGRKQTYYQSNQSCFIIPVHVLRPILKFSFPYTWQLIFTIIHALQKVLMLHITCVYMA